MGGLKINTNTEVLKADGSVIPGLFAAGEVTGGYCDVNAAIINAGASRGGDVSEYFDPDAEGYAIYNGTYMVNAEVLERLEAVGARIWRTDEQGSIVVRIREGQGSSFSCGFLLSVKY